MEATEVAGRPPPQDADTTSVRGYVVIVGEPADGGSAFRIEDPARLLRVWAMLQATAEQLNGAALPPGGMPALQRQLVVIRREAERSVSPPVAAELQRLMPPQDEVPSAGALRIECAVLVSWVGSLVMQMLGTFTARANDGKQVPVTRSAQ